MELQDKIYGLIAQAQEMQKFALEFQGTANDTLYKLPSAVEKAVSVAAREILARESEKASTALLDASTAISDAASGAKAAAAEIRDARAAALKKHIAVLFFVAVVLSGGMWGWTQYLTSELESLEKKKQAMQKTVDKLNGEYGKAVFSTCGSRPCVRVDARAGAYGNEKKGEVFYILFNY